ncbi:hypothetical protein BT93_H0961 [Corymbia citriodora subsp. variegata]|nr:hypothetical protein BT93_H0961 [Corymbia citriodora subsp. variegata]
MDKVLCDELLQENLIRPSPSPHTLSSFWVPLVSRQSLHLFRESRTTLSLRLAPNTALVPTLSSLFTNYPPFSSLSLVLSSGTTPVLLLCSHSARLPCPSPDPIWREGPHHRSSSPKRDPARPILTLVGNFY